MAEKLDLALVDKWGQHAYVVEYHVEWTPGIKHGRSRFGHSGGCEACGKRIPSGRFVPVEARDDKSGDLVSLWLGCDCARNIFGIKDEGLARTSGGE